MRLGLGFAFGGKDKGMSDQLEAQTKHFGLMGKAVSDLDAILSQNKLSNFLEAISLSRLNDIAGGVAHLAEEGRNLTTSYEGELVAAHKSGMAMAANLGMNTKAMGKFANQATSLGISLNVGTEAAGKSIYAMDNYGDSLKAIGIDSAATAAKFQAVYNIDPSKFGATLAQAQKTLHLTDAQLKELTQSTVAWGQQSGDVSAAIGGMEKQVEDLTAQAQSMGKTMSPDQLVGWAKSVNTTKQFLYSLTGDLKGSDEAAENMSKTFMDTRKNMGKMYAGQSDDINELQKSFASLGININDQFKLMDQGPMGFIQGLTEMAEKTGKPFKEMTAEQQNFFKRTIEASGLGEAAQQKLNLAMEEGPASLKKLTAALPKATEDLGKLSKAAFTTGRTLQDQMNLQEEQFVAHLRTGSKVNAEFVKDTGKAYKHWGDALLKLSKENGPLGMITKKMIEMHQIGALALIPTALRPMAGVFGTIVKEAGPLIGILGSLGVKFSMLFNPITLMAVAVVALVGWFAELRGQGFTTEQAIAGMGEAIISFADRLPKRIDKAFSQVDKALTHFFDKSAKPSVWSKVFDTVWNSIKKAAEEVWSRLKEVASGFWDGLTGNIKPGQKTAGEHIGEMLGTAFRNGLKIAWETLKKGAADLFKGDLTGEGILVGALGLTALVTLGGPVLTVLGAIGSVLGTIVSAGAAVGGVLLSVNGLIAGAAALVVAFMLWPDETQKAMDKVGDVLGSFTEDAFNILTTGILDAVDWIVAKFSSGGAASSKSFLDMLIDLPAQLGNLLASAATAVGEALTSVFSVAEKVVLGALSGIETALITHFPESAGTIIKVFDGIKSFVSGVFDDMKLGITIVAGVVGAAFELMGHVISSGWHFIAKLSGWLWDEVIGPQVTSLWENVIKPVWDRVAPFFSSVFGGISTGVDKMIKEVKSFFGDLTKFFDEGFGKIDAWVDKLFRHSISSDMKDDFDAASKHASIFSKDVNKSLSGVVSPMAGLSMAGPGPTGGAPALPPPARPAPSVSASAREEGLIDAINMPAWYGRYERLFASKMDALMQATQGAAPVSAPGGRSVTPRRQGARGDGTNMGLNINMVGDLSGGT